jgi:hypothetical protein
MSGTPPVAVLGKHWSDRRKKENGNKTIEVIHAEFLRGEE